MKNLRQRAFSLIEVMFSIVIISIILVPSITAIQASRVRMRSMSQNLVAENLAVSVMEMVKRAGFDDYAYGDTFQTVLDTTTVPSPLLDFPRNAEPDGDPADGENQMPAGAPGGLDDDDFSDFLSEYRSGTLTYDDAVENDAIASDDNYYFYSSDQIAAINGYDTWDDIPDTDDPDTSANENKTESLLNPQYAWGFYSELFNGPDDSAGTTDDLRHVAVIVKWIDTRTGRRQFTVLESWVVRQAHRLSLP